MQLARDTNLFLFLGLSELKVLLLPANHLVSYGQLECPWCVTVFGLLTPDSLFPTETELEHVSTELFIQPHTMTTTHHKKYWQ